jgi:hypothetical protein
MNAQGAKVPKTKHIAQNTTTGLFFIVFSEAVSFPCPAGGYKNTSQYPKRTSSKEIFFQILSTSGNSNQGSTSITNDGHKALSVANLLADYINKPLTHNCGKEKYSTAISY